MANKSYDVLHGKNRFLVGFFGFWIFLGRIAGGIFGGLLGRLKWCSYMFGCFFGRIVRLRLEVFVFVGCLFVGFLLLNRC